MWRKGIANHIKIKDENKETKIYRTNYICQKHDTENKNKFEHDKKKLRVEKKELSRKWKLTDISAKVSIKMMVAADAVISNSSL